MMKITLFLVLAYIALAFGKSMILKDALISMTRHSVRGEFGQSCVDVKCAKSNEECGYIDYEINTVSTGCISENDYCNITTSDTTDYATGVCIAGAALGEKCSTRQCNLGLTCKYVSLLEDPVCVAFAYNVTRYPGERCGTGNVVCTYQNPDTLADENVCNSGICKYLADGATCNPSANQCNSVTSECVYVSTTSLTTTCRARIALNAACTTNSSDSTYINCQDELTCIPTSVNSPQGTCREYFSQKKGGACQSIIDCKDGVCADPATENTLFGVCKNFRKTSTLHKKCVNNDDCTSSNGEDCVCNGDGDSKCSNYYPEREFYKLAKDNLECQERAEDECAYLNSNGGNEDAERAYSLCTAKICKSPTCKYYKDMKSNYGFNEGDFGCDFVQLCDASGLFASLPILAAIATIVLLLQ